MDSVVLNSLNDKELETKIEELSVSLAGAKIERARRRIGETPTAKISGRDKKLAELLGISAERVPFLKEILAEAEKLGVS